jgi:hypothetical protein
MVPSKLQVLKIKSGIVKEERKNVYILLTAQVKTTCLEKLSS